ncbi:MAG: hypothetical protein LBP59_01870 [Planctomycetaceae bacterium]|nr:hypothetical protein [Planctomycetaceae bacterium]
MLQKIVRRIAGVSPACDCTQPLVMEFLNCSYFNLRFTFACLVFGRQALTLLNL